MSLMDENQIDLHLRVVLFEGKVYILLNIIFQVLWK